MTRLREKLIWNLSIWCISMCTPQYGIIQSHNIKHSFTIYWPNIEIIALNPHYYRNPCMAMAPINGVFRVSQWGGQIFSGHFMLKMWVGQTMFSYFFLWPKLKFLPRGPWPNPPLKRHWYRLYFTDSSFVFIQRTSSNTTQPICTEFIERWWCAI